MPKHAQLRETTDDRRQRAALACLTNAGLEDTSAQTFGANHPPFRLLRCWPALLVLASATMLGLAHGPAAAAQPQIVDTAAQSYYASAKPLMDYALPELLKAAPELEGLEPATTQDDLASILEKVGKETSALLESTPNLVSQEDVSQEKLSATGKVLKQAQRQYEYLILLHHQNDTVHIEEYRPPADQTASGGEGLKEGFMLTRGFAGTWLHFLPENKSAARFRYLGRQTVDGQKCSVVAFAQKPGWATMTGTVVFEGRAVLILFQGIAWIDPATSRIVQLRTDLLAPRPDIGLQKQTTLLQFGEFHLAEAPSPLWLPHKVIVTSQANKEYFRNVHSYSGYQLYRVETKILPASPD